jgi:hypothetical protein
MGSVSPESTGPPPWWTSAAPDEALIFHEAEKVLQHNQIRDVRRQLRSGDHQSFGDGDPRCDVQPRRAGGIQPSRTDKPRAGRARSDIRPFPARQRQTWPRRQPANGAQNARGEAAPRAILPPSNSRRTDVPGDPHLLGDRTARKPWTGLPDGEAIDRDPGHMNCFKPIRSDFRVLGRVDGTKTPAPPRNFWSQNPCRVRVLCPLLP